VDNCTYIHDERYPGVPVPPNYSNANQPHSGGRRPDYAPPAGYPPYSQPPSSNPRAPQSGYSSGGAGHVPYSNPGYYTAAGNPHTGSNYPSNAQYPSSSATYQTGSSSYSGSRKF
jgi:hypothetical protein